MSEAARPDSDAAEPVAAVPSEPSTAGAMLRRAREAAGLHLAAMAVALKVPPGKLEALEQDRYELLPDIVFARGLASAICRSLKIDPKPVLERLPQTSAPRLIQDTDGLNAPFRSPRDAVATNWREQATRPVSIVVAALLVGAVVVLLLPRNQHDDSAVASANTQAKPAVATREPAAVPTGQLPQQQEAPTAPASATEPQTAGAIVPASMSLPAAPAPAVIAPAPVAPAAAAPVAAPPAAAASGLVVFRASGSSWIEVRDAKGAVVVRKLMASGEAAGISGAVPLHVVVGNADATAVEVRGQAFDLRPFARDNVARFEVK